MTKAKDPRFGKRDTQLAEDWQWLANTPQGRRIIADLMVWGNVYSPIEESDPIRLAMATGENNFAKRVAYYLGFRADQVQFPLNAQEDTDLLNRMLESRAH